MKKISINLFFIINFFLVLTLTNSSTVLQACTSSSCCKLGQDVVGEGCAFPGSNQINTCDNVYGMTNFVTHPVQWDAFRRMSGVHTEKLHRPDADEFYGVTSLALQYQQTTKSNHLAQWFSFSNHKKNCMTYGPNETDDGSTFAYDINSLNFGVTATGKITFSPRIQNFIADIDIYMGWDQFVCGLWSRISIPINWTRWDLNLCDSSTPGYAPTFLINQMRKGDPVDVLYANLKEAWVGNKPFGDAPVMTSGTINGAQTTTQVAGLKLELGYDFVSKTDRHFATSFLVVIPTGNAPTAQFLFEPISGSNKQWEVGIDLNGHYDFWESTECNKSLGIHFDAAFMAMTKREQKRLFGLQAGGSTSPVIAPTCGSASAGASWLLLKEFDITEEFVTLQRASNVLALEAKIGASFETNLGLMLKYIYNHLSIDFGYELYYRNSEKISNRTALPDEKYGIKGGTDLSLTGDNTASTSTISSNGVTDVPKILLTDANVCVCTALQPAYSSNKIFNFYEYSWDNCDWMPTFGAGCSFEWANKRSGAKNTAVDQWSVLVKGAVLF